MKHRIAILSDIHGNTTALEAVIKDAQELGATEYWLMEIGRASCRERVSSPV